MVAGSSVGELIREDLSRHGSRVTNPGFVALVSYRFGTWRDDLPAGTLRKVLRVPYLMLHRRVRNRHRIELHYTSVIGRRVRLSGRGDIVIGNHVVVGDDCSIGQGVTLGKTRDDATGWPVIGDRVAIGPGAVIAGDIHIGDDVEIGPNSVVLADLPAGAKASARPAVLAKDEEPGRPGQASTRRIAARDGSRQRKIALPELLLRTRRIGIAETARIGPGLWVHRDGNLAIGERVTLGRDTVVGYGVTIGWRDDQAVSRPAATQLGDRVVLGVGAVVVAGVTIGDDVRVGPNAVVTEDLPEGAVVVCPPAGVLRSLRPATA